METEERLTAQHAVRFEATLDPLVPSVAGGADGAVAPLGIHWTLAPIAVAPSQVGTDGHPRRGAFIPPIPLERRMWASGALRFHDSIRIGDIVRRRSVIADIQLKNGKAGALWFVSIDHELDTERGPALSERQDVVFLAAADPVRLRDPAGLSAPAGGDVMRLSEVDLFRYSALTFNGHRIHFDREYAATEGYPDLVVQGPLQATILMNRAADIMGGAGSVTNFSFRGIRPLFVNDAFRVCESGEEGPTVSLEIRTARDETTMTAVAS